MSISNMALTDENKEVIKNNIDEVNAFIKQYNLTFKKVNDKKRELQTAYDDFSCRIEEQKFKNLKNNVYSVYKDLIINNLKFSKIGKKYPGFYSYLAKDEVSNYVNKLIESDPEFS